MVHDEPEFWSWLAALHGGRTSTLNPNPHHFATFADWLQDHDDWRHPLFRNVAEYKEGGALESPYNGSHLGYSTPYVEPKDRLSHGSFGFTELTGDRDQHGEPVYKAYTQHTVPGSDRLGFYSILHPSHISEMLELNPSIKPAVDRADAMREGKREKLARNLAGRLWDRIVGAKPAGKEWHPHYDGILHTGGGLEGYPKAFAERSAVSQALQRMGGSAAQAPHYTQLASRFVRLFPDHQLSKHYTEKAEKIGNPGVVGEDTRYSTVPASGPVGMELASAVTPLVRFLNRLEAKNGKAKVITPALPESLRKVPELPPAATAPRINLDELLRRAHERNAADERPPIPLANYPGETGPTGDRWSDLDKMHAAGTSKLDLLKHLKDRYGLTSRNALGTLKRWMGRRGAKLSGLSQREIPDSQLHGTHLGYHLRQLVSEGMKTGDLKMAGLARQALGFTGLNPKRDPVKTAGTGEATGPGWRVTANGQAVPIHSGDPYADLGRHLQSTGHRLARAYNWSSMQASMMRDRKVEQALRSLLSEAKDDHHLFTGASRMFDLGMGQKANPRFAEFWQRIKRAVGGSTDKINDSLKRLADRAENRREIATEPAADWRKVFNWLPGSKYMKFNRQDKLDLIRLSRSDARVRACLAELL